MSADWSPDQIPTLVIIRMARSILKLVDDHLLPVGITSAQLPVLVALKNGERRTQRELTELAEVEQPSMAQLIARMERDNLIRREPSPGDKRSSLISLTEHALELLEPGREALRQVDAEARAGFTEEERAALMALLRRMNANVQAALT